MSAVAPQTMPMTMKATKRARRREAAAVTRGPIVRKVWSATIAAVSYPTQKDGGGVNNRYAKLILRLEGATEGTTYYSWLNKGWMYDLDGMVNAPVKVQIRQNNGDGTAKCFPVDIASLKQHMLANKIPNNHKAMTEPSRAALQRTYTDPGSLNGESHILLNSFARQSIRAKKAWS